MLVSVSGFLDPIEGEKGKMTLGEKQREFTRLVSLLINYAYQQKFEFTFGEAWRPPEMAELYAKQGKGIKNSLHTKRLAIDLNLFQNGKYLTDSKDYEILGKYWESLSTDQLQCCWGGRFSKPDGNHFSISHEGIK